MKLKLYYGGHSVSDKGILKLKLKTDFTQQEEAGALYATVAARLYKLTVVNVEIAEVSVDSVKIDNKFDTTIIFKGLHDDDKFSAFYNAIKSTSEDEMVEVDIEPCGGNK